MGTSHGVIPQSSREVVVPPSQQQYQTHSAASSLPRDNSLLHVGQNKVKLTDDKSVEGQTHLY